MAERATGYELLLPCLLDRLTDNKPNSSVESRANRGITAKRYRDGVLRDLGWLLNTCSHPSDNDLSGYQEVIKAVLNYGVKNLGGRHGSLQNSRDIEGQIKQAILSFEPRILPETLKVDLVIPKGQNGDHDHCLLSLEIHGELWLQPLPERLYIKTSIDLETGECVFQNR